MIIQRLKGQRVIAQDPQGNLSTGEFTGLNQMTGRYTVSFYNGYTKGFSRLEDINFN